MARSGNFLYNMTVESYSVSFAAMMMSAIPQKTGVVIAAIGAAVASAGN